MSSDSQRPDVLEINSTCDTPLLIPTILNDTSSNGSSAAAALTMMVDFANSTFFDNSAFNRTDLANVDNSLTSWICGIAVVVLSTILPLFGFAFLPFTKRKWFASALLFSVSHCVGHIISVSLLVYFPKAIGLDLFSGGFVKQSSYSAVIIVLFTVLFLSFNFEVVNLDPVMSTKNCFKRSRKLCVRKSPSRSCRYHDCLEPSLPESEYNPNRNRYSRLASTNSAAAYLFVFADSLVTLIDGIRVGWAFSSFGLIDGTAVAFTIFTEQITRKIGGCVVLYFIGSLSIAQAVGCMMITSCFFFLGFVTGTFFYYPIIKLITPWLYTIVIALFYHIFLIVVVPHVICSIVVFTSAPKTSISSHEMLVPGSSSEANGTCSLLRLLITNLGLIIGFCISLIIFFYAETLRYMINL